MKQIATRVQSSHSVSAIKSSPSIHLHQSNAGCRGAKSSDEAGCRKPTQTLLRIVLDSLLLDRLVRVLASLSLGALLLAALFGALDLLVRDDLLLVIVAGVVCSGLALLGLFSLAPLGISGLALLDRLLVRLEKCADKSDLPWERARQRLRPRQQPQAPP